MYIKENLNNKINGPGSLMLPASATLGGWVRVTHRMGWVVVVEMVEMVVVAPRHLRLAFARGRWW
jgi:hypothetical protein